MMQKMLKLQNFICNFRDVRLVWEQKVAKKV